MAPVKCPACTTSRPTDQKDQVSCLTTDKSTILETNHNVNAVTNTNTSNASFRLSSKVNTSSKIINKEFRSNSSNYFSNVSDSSPSKSNSENNPCFMNLFSRDELGLLLHDEEGIPPDASLLPFKFVAILCMMKSVENGTIIKIDIAKIGYTVEDQLHARIYKEYTVHGNIIIFEKLILQLFWKLKT